MIGIIGTGENRQAIPINDRMIDFIKKNNFRQKVDRIFAPKIQTSDLRNSSLHQIKDLYEDQLGPDVMREFHDELLGRPGEDIYVSGREEKVQPLIEWLMSELITHKENFQYIFKTSRGSIYFVLPTGESLRFKMTDPKIRQGLFGPVKREEPLREQFITIEPVVDKCHFIDEAEKVKIQEAAKQTSMIKINIQTTKFGKDTIPLEVMSAYKHGEGYQSVEADSRGVLHLGYNVSSYHPGTKITEIIHNKTH